MSFVRTVLGDIAPEELGVCYSHEHLIIDASYATENEPDFLIDSVDSGVAELRELKQIGVGACVDSMPCDCGRNVEKLVEISRQTGVHIVAPTGFHLAKYYSPEQHEQHGFLDLDTLRWRFQKEIEEGIANSGIKCGIIKVAALEQWDGWSQTIFLAAADAHRETGAPILTHTENGQMALEQARFFAENDVNLNHVVLSHLDRNLNVDYHREVLRTGVAIEYDSHFRWEKQAPNPTLQLLQQMLPEFPDQIVLGMDAARRSYWKSYGGAPGLSFLYSDFKQQMMDAGIDDELIHKVFVSTPARVFSFASKNH